MLDRSVLKGLVERLFASAAARRFARSRRSNSRLVLAYHNVVASGMRVTGGDRSLHLPFDHFRVQLDSLNKLNLDVVPLDQPRSAGGRPEIAITFDDACVGALEVGVVELADRGLPATLFVAPGMLGASAPWWDLLSSPSEGVVPHAIREEALVELGGDHDAIMRAAASRGWSIGPASSTFRIGTEADLEVALQRHKALTLGAHSWSHPNLARLDATSLSSELTRPLAWLQARWGERVIPWMAYPYGIDSPAVQAAASKAGYRGALRVRGGWYRAETNPFTISRYNVAAGTSLLGFEARVAGLFPS